MSGEQTVHRRRPRSRLTATLATLLACTVLAAGSATRPAGAWAATANLIWRPTRYELPVARRLAAATTGPDGNVYLLGGLTGTTVVSTVRVFSASTQRWRTVAPMHSPRAVLAAVTGPDGRIYAIGGFSQYGGGSYLATVESYDVGTDSWRAEPPMSVGRSSLGAAVGSDGRIYAIGGNTQTIYTASVEAFSTTTKTWTAAASMHDPREAPAVTALGDGRIIALGGWGIYDVDRSAIVTTNELFDPATDKWTLIAPMQAQRAEASASSLGGRVYAIGGAGSNGHAVESYDPGSDTWRAEPSLVSPQRVMAASAVVGGRLSVFGGADFAWKDLSSSEQLVDTGQPDAPLCRPGGPTVTAAGAASVTVHFTGCGPIPPDQAYAAPTGYRVEAYQSLTSGEPAVASSTVALSATSATVSGLTGGKRYALRVIATNARGDGPESTVSDWALPPFASLAAFVARQYRDLAGRAPTAAEAQSAAAALRNGTSTPAASVDGLLGQPWSAPTIEPVTRLYKAYFLRNPDTGGLRYWVTALRAGRPLATASSTFAGSAEFAHRYGSLSNNSFVKLVYQNVLGRPGEASGVAYWTGQLDAHARTRGQVMVGFSESSEYRTRVRPDVDVTDVLFGLLDRAPTGGELASWTAAFRAGAPRADLISTVLDTAEYATHSRS